MKKNFKKLISTCIVSALMLTFAAPSLVSANTLNSTMSKEEIKKHLAESKKTFDQNKLIKKQPIKDSDLIDDLVDYETLKNVKEQLEKQNMPEHFQTYKDILRKEKSKCMPRSNQSVSAPNGAIVSYNYKLGSNVTGSYAFTYRNAAQTNKIVHSYQDAKRFGDDPAEVFVAIMFNGATMVVPELGIPTFIFSAALSMAQALDDQKMNALENNPSQQIVVKDSNGTTAVLGKWKTYPTLTKPTPDRNYINMKYTSPLPSNV